MISHTLSRPARLLCVLCLLVVGRVFSQAASGGFHCEVWHAGAFARTLSFGVSSTSEGVSFQPYPKGGPAGDVYFQGHYDASLTNENRLGDFFWLSDDIRYLGTAQSATWTLSSTRQATLRFRLSAGSSLPPGSVLKLDGRPLVMDAPVKVEAGGRCIITYQSGEAVLPAPEQPDNLSFDMVRKENGEIQAKVSVSAVLQGTACGYDASGKKLMEAYGQASIRDGLLTYRLPATLDARVSTVFLAYKHVTAAGESVPAMILIEFREEAPVPAAEFAVELWYRKATAPSVRFGLTGNPDKAILSPFPPNGPTGSCYLLGRYEEANLEFGEDYFRASEDIRLNEGISSATWTLRAMTNQSSSVTFKFVAGTSLPAGAMLRIDGVEVRDGTSMTLRSGRDYLITYQSSSSEPVAPGQPENYSFSMTKGAGYSSEFTVSKDAILVSAPKGYDVNGMAVDGVDCGTAEIVGDRLTYTLPAGDLSQISSVSVAIANLRGGVQSVPSAVVIYLTDSPAIRLLSENHVTLKPGKSGAGENTAFIQYEIVVPDSFAMDTLALSLTLPAWTTMGSVPFPYTAEVALYDSEFQMKQGANLLEASASGYVNELVLPVQGGGRYYVGVTLTAVGTDAESDSVRLEAPASEGCSVSDPYILIQSPVTLDFDGNGVVDTNDAIMFYNFVNQQGMDIPELFDGSDGLAMLTESIVVELADAENCRQFMQTVPTFLDFDENGLIEVTDAIMLYNFISQQGVDYPELFDGESGLNMLCHGIPIDRASARRALTRFQEILAN